ncbi:SDR family oxidoreductase [Allobranchiibius huperziae]|uniref:NADP-dependent 3-hydroxy acid dehydrogenase YdfG n=1 Tax=Allobranchiibius huperziae TaxID=1874116 RepID=A0A853DFS0_9MICO|nr:SDR family oxidoreductase [Allobranchiibius huperziae]NYJ75648.1 NADP-dependent 3-hydroxy acid dehydrogenase YdfG [Allobranchiibius huperziae]
MSGTGKTVLITGGTRGIGRAVAESLSASHHLLIGGRDEASVKQTCVALRSAEPFVADLANEEATAAAAESIGELDAVVHSAGLVGHGPLTSLSRADWRRTMELNVVAVADLTRLLLPQLRRAQGTVVVINSGSGLTARVDSALYSASKFAVRALADSVREQEREHGVRVTTIYPGRVDTDMQRELVEAQGGQYDGGLYIRPSSIAAAVRLAIEMPADASVDDLSVRPGPR